MRSLNSVLLASSAPCSFFKPGKRRSWTSNAAAMCIAVGNVSLELYSRNTVITRLRNEKNDTTKSISNLRKQSILWFPCKMTSEEQVQKFHTDDVTTQIWKELLIGWSKFSSWDNQSEALRLSGWWCIISMEFLHLFLRHHFVRKPVAASRNVGCFLRHAYLNHNGDSWNTTLKEPKMTCILLWFPTPAIWEDLCC